MKNKFISTISVAAICTAMLSTQVFATDITKDRSVYAADSESIPCLSESNTEFGTYIVDLSTVMPLYYANIYDYAKTGNFDIRPFWFEEGEIGQKYISDAVNENGDFVGTMEFSIDGEHPGIHMFTPRTNKADSVAFEPNARRISAAMEKQKISSNCEEVKLVFVNGIGHVYYIDNGTSKMLAAANYYGVNGEVFNDINGGIVEINDDLKAYADRKLAELEEYKREVIDKLAPGENPPEGGGDATPTFKVDNTPYLTENDSPTTSGDEKNPDTGRGIGIATGTAALISLTAGAVVLAKRRKDNRRNQL